MWGAQENQIDRDAAKRLMESQDASGQWARDTAGRAQKGPCSTCEAHQIVHHLECILNMHIESHLTVDLKPSDGAGSHTGSMNDMGHKKVVHTILKSLRPEDKRGSLMKAWLIREGISAVHRVRLAS